MSLLGKGRACARAVVVVKITTKEIAAIRIHLFICILANSSRKLSIVAKQRRANAAKPGACVRARLRANSARSPARTADSSCPQDQTLPPRFPRRPLLRAKYSELLRRKVRSLQY